VFVVEEWLLEVIPRTHATNTRSDNHSTKVGYIAKYVALEAEKDKGKVTEKERSTKV
jgi:hypothetical protein